MPANYITTAIIETIEEDEFLSGLFRWFFICHFTNKATKDNLDFEAIEDSQSHIVRLDLFKLAIRVRPMLAHSVVLRCHLTGSNITNEQVTGGQVYLALRWLYDHQNRLIYHE